MNKKELQISAEMIEHLPKMQRAYAKYLVMSGEIRIVGKPQQPSTIDAANNKGTHMPGASV